MSKAERAGKELAKQIVYELQHMTIKEMAEELDKAREKYNKRRY
jgi:hypothetical protein